MNAKARTALKVTAFWCATVAVAPLLFTYWISSRILDPDRALQGSTELLALVPGLVGQYVRRAFLVRVLSQFHRSATIEFGTILSKADARIGENVYVGPCCHLGSVDLEADVLLAAGVHVPSGANIHGTADPSTPIREQPGTPRTVRIGRGSWIGSAAIVMADVGSNTVVGAGSVVTKPIPENVVAAGAPARVVRHRAAEANEGSAGRSANERL
jgi:acetyltransferase-like isoleucine patch superfamily enzyme